MGFEGWIFFSPRKGWNFWWVNIGVLSCKAVTFDFRMLLIREPFDSVFQETIQRGFKKYLDDIVGYCLFFLENKDSELWRLMGLMRNHLGFRISSRNLGKDHNVDDGWVGVFFFLGGGMSLVTSWNFKQNMGWNQRNSLVTLGLYGMTTCTPWSKYMANRPQKIGQKAGLKYKPIQGNCAIYPGVHPWTLIFSNTNMKVWFRWFSHANGWFSGSSR